MTAMKNAILWTMGGIFLLLSISMLITSLWTSLCFVAIGLIFLPPIRKRYLSEFTWRSQIITGCTLFIIAALTASPDLEEPTAENQNTALIDKQKVAPEAKEDITEREIMAVELSESSEKAKKARDIKLAEQERIRFEEEQKEELKKQRLITSLESKTQQTKRAGELLSIYQELVKVDPDNASYEAKIKEYTAILGDLVKVIGVSDGDSITVLTSDKKQIFVNLYAIDAPESGQEYSRKSKDRLGELLRNAKQVYLEKKGRGSDGTMLAYVYLPDLQLVNSWSLREGCSWHLKKTNLDQNLSKDENYARVNKLGLWAGYSPMSPMKYRERQQIAKELQAQKKKQELAKRNLAKKKSTSNGSSKKEPASDRYWLNTKSYKRHNAGCRWYGSTSNGRPCKAHEGSACGICGG